MPKNKEAVDELFSEENIPESNWAKFDEIGKKVGGTLVGVKDQPEKNGMPAQRVYILKQTDGTTLNVGVAVTKDYVIGRANTAQMGDLLGFHYIKDIPASTKGHAPAKSIEVYVKHVATPATEDDFI